MAYLAIYNITTSDYLPNSYSKLPIFAKGFHSYPQRLTDDLTPKPSQQVFCSEIAPTFSNCSF